ncbi:carbohydrate kinase family protein [Paenibacillus montanisoli]|uniref:carbohydrate kinase family protein n=1 Tax=Paenibacillus montanisoli TaxID=2081970 RepID=UPI001403C2A2|nr:PfkB family carbohydrate kinase [Paenibacillus montanisoli]
MRTAGIGVVGKDAFGDFVRAKLAESGMLMDYVTVDAGVKTGIGVALCKDNDRAILTYLGSIDRMDALNVQEELFQQARHLHIGSYYLMRKLQPSFVEMARKAKANGMTVSLDTNWDPDENWDSGIWELLPYVDIFLPNENELKRITKQPTVGQALELLNDVVPITVLKQGERGAIAYSQGKAYPAEPLKVGVIDAVGAGDSFDAGFIYGYLSGFDVSTSVQIGCICGSMSTSKPGGVAGQVREDELLRRLLKTLGEAG